MAQIEENKRLEKEKAAKDKKIAQLREFISRFKAGTRSSQTRSRAKQIERLRIRLKPEPHFRVVELQPQNSDRVESLMGIVEALG